MRTVKTAPDGWIPFLRTLARNSKLKFVISETAPAATDGKTMWLPALPANLTKDDLVMFKGNALHEVGHLRHSDIEHYQAFAKAEGAFARFVLNCLDDVWMEGRMAGWKAMASQLLRESTELLIVRNQFRDGSKDLAEAVGCFCLTYQTAKRWPSIHKANLAVTANLRKHLGEHADKMIPLLCELLDKEFPAVKSTQDCSALTLKVIELFKSESEKEESQDESESEDDKEQSEDQNQSGNSSDAESEPNGDDSDEDESKSDGAGNNGSDDSDDGDTGNSSDESNPDPKSNANADDEGDEEGNEGAGAKGGKTLKELVDEMLNAEPGEGEVFDKGEAFKEIAGQIASSGKSEYKGQPLITDLVFDGEGKEEDGFVDGMPVVQADRYAASLIAERVGRKSGVLANRLLALLANREEADPYSSRNGALDERNLYRFAMDDSRIFAKCDDVIEPTAAVSITADLSGSTMMGAAGETVADEIRIALTLIEKVLNQVGTPREILGFAPKSGEVSCMVKSFTDNSRVATDRIAGMHAVVGGGSTPIGKAVMQSGSRLMAQEADRKLLLVLTDGAPDSKQEAIEMTKSVLNQGVEVIYLVIGDSNYCDWLKEANIKFANAKKGEELLPALISKVGEFLI